MPRDMHINQEWYLTSPFILLVQHSFSGVFTMATALDGCRAKISPIIVVKGQTASRSRMYDT